MKHGVEQGVTFHMPPERNDMLWRVHKENLIFFAGVRAMGMEILDPRIAASLVKNAANPQSGRFERHPLKRLYETSEYGLKLIFGTQAEADEIAGRINAMHRNVHGKTTQDVGVYPAGTEYNAFNPEQMKWIAATLLDSSLVGYETFVGPLSQRQRDRYVQQASELFKILHFNPDIMPKNHQELQEYIQGRIDRGELKMGDDAKRLAPYISVRHDPVWKILSQGLHMATVYTMPPEIRREFGYTLSPVKKEIVEKAAKGLQKVGKFIPREIRHPRIYLRDRKLIKGQQRAS